MMRMYFLHPSPQPILPKPRGTYIGRFLLVKALADVPWLLFQLYGPVLLSLFNPYFSLADAPCLIVRNRMLVT
jgi:hypothetical protein